MIIDIVYLLISVNSLVDVTVFSIFYAMIVTKGYLSYGIDIVPKSFLKSCIKYFRLRIALEPFNE